MAAAPDGNLYPKKDGYLQADSRPSVRKWFEYASRWKPTRF